MATSNFYNVNASKVYAATIEDEWEYEDLIGNIKAEFEKTPYHFRSGGKDNNELRSYPSSVIGSITKTKQYKDFEVSVTLTIVVRSGYYGGANLDWSLEYEVEGEDTDNTEDFARILEYQMDWNYEGKAKQFAGYAEKWAEKAREEVINYVEGIFEQYTTPLKVAARFSNGETIYEKA